MSELPFHRTPRPSVGAVLEDDHRRIDALLTTFGQSLSAGTVDEASFAMARTGLRHHIYVEEELHFPTLRQAGLLGPIMVMVREHSQIWNVLDTMETSLRGGASLGELSELLHDLEQLLAAHNAKEEQIVYPAGDQVLTAEAAESVRATLASGTTPSGWVPEMSSGA